MGLKMVLNNSRCRDVLWSSESQTGTAITALLTDIPHQGGHSLPLVTDGRIRADVLAGG
jgi:hypothetical protein